MIKFRTNADGSAVCPHRDLYVCPECAKDKTLVEVYGIHFHVPNPFERAALRRELAKERKVVGNG